MEIPGENMKLEGDVTNCDSSSFTVKKNGTNSSRLHAQFLHLKCTVTILKVTWKITLYGHIDA